MLSDDSSHIKKDMSTTAQAVKLVHAFSRRSDFQLNFHKTEIILIDSNHKQQATNPVCLSNIKVRNGSFKILGIWFSKILMKWLS